MGYSRILGELNKRRTATDTREVGFSGWSKRDSIERPFGGLLIALVDVTDPRTSR